MHLSRRPKRLTSNRAIANSSRSVALSRQALLLGLLLISLIIAIAYASTVIYAWARETARTLPNVTAVDLPQVILPASAERNSSADAGIVLPGPVEPRKATGTDLPVPMAETEQLERITVLILGVDQRPDDPSPPRTDNMIVLTLEPVSGRIGMISLPRDLFVPIPGFDRAAKINTAYVIGESNDYPGGGGALAKKTVSEFLGYPVDYYAKVNFDGFVKAIDLIGGIDVDVPKTIHDDLYPTIDYGYTTFHIDAGPQHLDGETALKYVRTRNTDDDFQRARRQQQVMLAIKDRVIDNKLLTTLRIFDLLEVMADSVQHDVPTAKLFEVASLGSRIEVEGVEQLVVDSAYGTIDADSPYGWILIPDLAKVQPRIHEMFATTATAPEPQVDLEALARQQAMQQAELARQQVRFDYEAQAETMRRQLAAEGARVVVYDGAGDPAMAARAADWLRGQGYDVVDFGQAERTDYPRTVLLAHSEKPVTIANLQDSFAIADRNIRRSNSSRSDVDLRLIIGRDFYLLVSN